ncbi:manganese efflux pump MntP [Aliikangiella sp. IMCC44632]
MIEVVLLAIALSMDAFAVSIILGSNHTHSTKIQTLLIASYFGVFQGVMPLIGYASGKGVYSAIENYTPELAFVLLLGVGSKMIYESLCHGAEEKIIKITHRVIFILAITTSIDAMAAGFALILQDFSIFFACLIIGITTFAFSYVGGIIGTKIGDFLKHKAEFLGGIVLILIGINILFSQ